VSKSIVVETWRQLVGVGVPQSLDASITTIGVETVVAHGMDVVTNGILIGSTTNLGNGLGEVLARSLALPVAIIRVVGTPHMVFTNPIMTTHVNKIVDRTPMSSMAIRGYKSADATNPIRGY
jgi:hypothetical protein